MCKNDHRLHSSPRFHRLQRLQWLTSQLHWIKQIGFTQRSAALATIFLMSLCHLLKSVVAKKFRLRTREVSPTNNKSFLRTWNLRFRAGNARFPPWNVCFPCGNINCKGRRNLLHNGVWWNVRRSEDKSIVYKLMDMVYK